MSPGWWTTGQSTTVVVAVSEERAARPALRLDTISIFPQYFDVLRLSLIGKALAAGLIELHTHDLREFTHDRHRTVDDTPYGGGAGMVMKPEPWGEALDALLGSCPPGTERPVLVFTTPSGEPFTQRVAGQLASAPRLAFACGRYEGIDKRVMVWAREYFEVRELSLGDYVLNGGEVAALAMIEAIVRLVPGVIGNPESLVEESYSPHTEGMLEYPVYTKPARWRGLDVPPVLLSGDHGAVDDWRAARSLETTRARRPDLLGQPPSRS
ncbi:tRNA (guanine37-N1)-methyltransferase [Propionibacterium cyclohexanicum]|uniref:tRNA (guanine-N(1)-)-methyltransferase n=1 Tax=Propionibacterium cyclohexanicum TaxID=64702 RepID=A0A1H9PRT5_9ACTN|nr:tRNA (guanine37-N1)-methyltransferase [Propionibacterium cyclohexanicum]